MSNIAPISQGDFTTDQVELIKRTVAPTATPAEFELFLYRCRHMGLDPLKPGEIYFIKFGGSPGVIVVGIEGFRKRAERSGKRAGIKRGVFRNEEGKCVGAWCEVFRSDWTEPAREEVSLAEYNTNRNNWAKMPETMIKKVAEAAALRMAFPDDLGGVYIEEEMESRMVEETDSVAQTLKPGEGTAGGHVIGGGDLKGQSIREVIERDGLPKTQDYFNRYEAWARKNRVATPKWLDAALINLQLHLEQDSGDQPRELTLEEEEQVEKKAARDLGVNYHTDWGGQ